jgi:hypothetical protein
MFVTGNYDTLLSTKAYFEDANILDLSSNTGSIRNSPHEDSKKSTTENTERDNDNTEIKNSKIENTENKNSEIENTEIENTKLINDSYKEKNRQKMITNIPHIFMDYVITRSDQVFSELFMKEILHVWVSYMYMYMYTLICIHIYINIYIYKYIHKFIFIHSYR